MPSKHAHHIVARRDPLSLLILIVAIVEPLMTLPQIWTVWVDQDIAGVSLLSWSCFTIAAALWVIYGFKIKNVPVIISSILWTTTEGLVALGVLIHH